MNNRLDCLKVKGANGKSLALLAFCGIVLSAVAFLTASTVLFPNRALAVLESQKHIFLKALEKEKVVRMSFAAGSQPFAGAILNHDSYGEWRLLRLDKDKVSLVASGRFKPEAIPLSFITFVTGDANALISIAEKQNGKVVADLYIYDMSIAPGQKLFELKRVVEPSIEEYSATQILLWQKDNSYFNSVAPPYKYNYYAISYDPMLNTYRLSFHLRKIEPTMEDEGLILNNRAIQLYREGNLKSAEEKLEEAVLLASAFRNTVMENHRLVKAEIDTLLGAGRFREPATASGSANLNSNSQANPSSANSADIIDRSKMFYLVGDYERVVMQLESAGSGGYKPDSLALLGLAYARMKDYANLQRVTKVLVERKYPALKEYYEEVSKILFYNRDMPALKAYLKVLESTDPLSPTLAYLKSAVLAEAGRLPFAKELLANYLSRVSDENRDLSLVREYLYEIATILGDTQLADRMLRDIVNADEVNLTALAYLSSFNGTLHTEQVKVPKTAGLRIEAPKQPLELFHNIGGEPPSQPPRP